MEVYLKSTWFFDFESKQIQEFVNERIDLEADVRTKAVALYFAVRDSWMYTSSTLFVKKEEWKASEIFKRSKGHCIDKSTLLVTMLRYAGVPARLHLAKVKNHIAAEKFMELTGTDELTPHGMVDVYIDNGWLKVSPAFNKELCTKLNVEPLDFDGESHSLFQEFDKKGGLFMEYLEDYGHFEDLPLLFIYENMKSHYKGLVGKMNKEGVINI